MATTKEKGAAPQAAPKRVVCICRGIGFPHGLAQTHRIRMIGKAAVAGGLDFSVLHIGGSPTDHNTQSCGEFEGMQFRYLPGSLDRPSHPLKRKVGYLHGALLALKEIRALRDNGVCVYAWLGRGGYGIACKAALRLFGVPVVQEVNEWWPGPMEWVRNALSLMASDATIVISRELETRLTALCSRFHPAHLVLRVPVLADPGAFPLPSRSAPASGSAPYLLWCGDVSGYLKDVRFMLQALLSVLKKGGECRLVLVGAASDAARESVNRYLEQLSLDRNSVTLAGYVSDQELKNLMSGARALLLPLWDDDRSRCRFPNKLGEYLFSQRPVITCRVGDLSEFLVDGESAHLCRPGDVDDFAGRIRRVLENPEEAELMSARGRDQAARWLDWRENSPKIAGLFASFAAGSPRDLTHG